MDGIKRLVCLAGCALVWTSIVGHAADSEPRRYAVLSLIGDKINIVGHEATVGSKMDRNRQGAIATEGRALDNMAVQAASTAIKRLDPRAETLMITVSDQRLYELQNELFEPQDRSIALLAAVKELLQSQNATHLILITKHRGDALLRLRDQYTGSGKIEGVGFYLDGSLRTHDLAKSATGQGFLAPFAYLTLTLVDARTMAVIRAQTVEQTETVSTAQAEGSLRPADALTPAQKAAALKRIIERAVARGVPAVLGPS